MLFYSIIVQILPENLHKRLFFGLYRDLSWVGRQKLAGHQAMDIIARNTGQRYLLPLWLLGAFDGFCAQLVLQDIGCQ